MAEYDAGLPNYKRYYQENTEHPIEADRPRSCAR